MTVWITLIASRLKLRNMLVKDGEWVGSLLIKSPLMPRPTLVREHLGRSPPSKDQIHRQTRWKY